MPFVVKIKHFGVRHPYFIMNTGPQNTLVLRRQNRLHFGINHAIQAILDDNGRTIRKKLPGKIERWLHDDITFCIHITPTRRTGFGRINDQTPHIIGFGVLGRHGLAQKEPMHKLGAKSHAPRMHAALQTQHAAHTYGRAPRVKIADIGIAQSRPIRFGQFFAGIINQAHLPIQVYKSCIRQARIKIGDANAQIFKITDKLGFIQVVQGHFTQTKGQLRHGSTKRRSNYLIF